MRARLAEMSRNCPQITIQILPFTSGACSAGSSGPFSILWFAGAPNLGVVHLAGPSGGICLDSLPDVASHTRAFTLTPCRRVTIQGHGRRLDRHHPPRLPSRAVDDARPPRRNDHLARITCRRPVPRRRSRQAHLRDRDNSFLSSWIPYITDLKAEITEHFGGAVHSTTEIMRTESHAGRELVRHAEDRFRIVAAPAVDQQVRRSAAEPVLGEESVLAQPVVLLYRADNVGTCHTGPGRHYVLPSCQNRRASSACRNISRPRCCLNRGGLKVKL